MAHLNGKTHTARKHVNVTHAHAKPHRKRYYALLIASVALGISVLTFLFVYVNQSAIGRAVASQTIESIFGAPVSSKAVSVSSSYGFTISYNAKQYYASAIDAETGGLYVGDELATTRAYDTLRLSTQTVGYASDTSSIRVTYYAHDAAPANITEVEQRYVVDKQTDSAKLTKVSTSVQDVHGISFQRTEWSRRLTVGAATFDTIFVTYAANLNGHPFTVVVYQGTQSAAHADEFMNAMTFSSSVAAATIAPTAAVTERRTLAERLIDTMLGTQVAYATSSAPSYTASERVSATYGPAVVKIYNVYIADLLLDGKMVYQDYLSGGTGSGFIVSGDGYIATNGHVVVNSPKETIIYLALVANSMGKSDILEYLLRLTSLRTGDLQGKSASDMRKVIIEALYGIEDSHFAFKNMQTNLLVGLGDKQVDINELVTRTEKRQAYPEQDTIKKATLENYDYGGQLLPLYTGEFKTSDVALLKLTSGANYPMVKLGTMRDAAQGSNLNIIGFPGTGSSSNGIVSKTVTSATLTTGKVSAQKEDNGGRAIIETDTEIGHGNSGGPAFADSGDVVGIATYTSDTGEAGDGVLNYIRDIADFTKLAEKKYVNYKTVSVTQTEWNRAIGFFYDAHYKSAIKSFAKVQQLYPSHPQVAAMIASSEKHIANGENIDEFPIVPVIVVAVLAVIGAAAAVVFIIVHKKKHRAYVHGVTTGQIQPMVPGMAPQPVSMMPGDAQASPAFQSAPFVPVSQPQPQFQSPPQPPTPVAPAPVVETPQSSFAPVSSAPAGQETPPQPASSDTPAEPPASQWPSQ